MGWVNVAKMPQQLIKALQTVRLPVPGVGLVLPLLELTSAVGADKALGVKLVSHGSDHSPLYQPGADTAVILGPGIIWNINNDQYQWSPQWCLLTNQLHLLQHCSAEHVCHVFFVKIIEWFLLVIHHLLELTWYPLISVEKYRGFITFAHCTGCS